MVIKRRAISDKQKEQRRQAILEVALQLFQESSYGAVNIAAVARQAGLAKGTVYLYFKTKEELFLAIQSQTFEAWFEEVDARLTAIQAEGEPCTIHEFVALISAALENRPVMIRLIAILHTILEQNIEFDSALSFKQMLRVHVLQTGPLVEGCLPFLQPGQGAQVLLRVHALVIGWQHMAEPAPIVQQVLEESDLDIFRVDFMAQFSDTLATLLQGLRVQATET